MRHAVLPVIDRKTLGEIRPLVAGMLAFATAMGIGRFAYTPILPTMERTAHLDIGLAGVLASVNYTGYLIGALLAAAVAVGPLQRRLAIGSLLAVILTTALMAETTDGFAWAGIRLVSGMASAGVFVLVGGIMLDFLRQAGRISWSGWIFGGVGIGMATSGLMVRAVDNAMGWRGDWITLAVVATATLSVSWPWLPKSGHHTDGGHSNPVPSSGGVATRATLALLLGAYLLEGAGYIVTGTFLVAIVDRMPGLGDVGSSMWILAGLAAIPSAVLWIRLAGRLGYVPALVLAYVAQACGIVLPALGSGLTIAIFAAILFGATFIGISALTVTLAGLLAPSRSSTAIGLLTAVFGLGQIAGPALGAFLAGHSHNFNLALEVTASMVFIAGALMLTLELLSSSKRARGSRQLLS